MLTSSKHFKPFSFQPTPFGGFGGFGGGDTIPPSFDYLTTELTLTARAGNTKGGSIIVPFTSCLTGLELVV